jgi:hypothetical protein
MMALVGAALSGRGVPVGEIAQSATARLRSDERAGCKSWCCPAWVQAEPACAVGPRCALLGVSGEAHYWWLRCRMSRRGSWILVTKPSNWRVFVAVAAAR